MLEVAEQYFELKQDNRFHVVIDDGLAFLDVCKREGIVVKLKCSASCFFK